MIELQRRRCLKLTRENLVTCRMAVALSLNSEYWVEVCVGLTLNPLCVHQR